MKLLYDLALIVLFFGLPHTVCGATGELDLIKTIEINKNSIKIAVHEQFKKTYLVDDFFVQYEPDVDLTTIDYSLVTLPFVLNIISIVWISGETYYIDSMDKDIYQSLKKIKEIFKRMYPKTSWEGQLIPRQLVENKPLATLANPSKECALLFSGGLDSTSSAIAHRDKKLLLITMRGQWDVPLDMDELWHIRERDIKEFARTYGHTNSFVVSNFSAFLNWDVLDNLSSEIAGWRLDTVEGMGMLGLAAPILYIKGYKTLLMASSFSWAYPWPSAANPIIDNNLIFAQAFALKNDQFEITRYDKLRMLVDLRKEGSIELPTIKVCDGQSAKNCLDNDCSKCIPFAFALLVFGENPRMYGFSDSNETIILKMKQYLELDQIYWTLWELSYLQDYMRNQKSIDEKLSWFLTADLAAHVSFVDNKEKEVITWEEYTDLIPYDLEIPDCSTRMLR